MLDKTRKSYMAIARRIILATLLQNRLDMCAFITGMEGASTEANRMQLNEWCLQFRRKQSAKKIDNFNCNI